MSRENPVRIETQSKKGQQKVWSQGTIKVAV